MTVERVELPRIGEVIGEPIDVFVCCASFEDRCRAIADELDRSRVRGAIVAENKKLRRYTGENSSHLRALFGEACIDARIDPSQPLASADGLAEALESIELDAGARWLIDITTFTHETLLILLCLLSRKLSERQEAWFAYTGASEYSVGSENAGKWLSKGVLDVRSVLGYPGRVLPSRAMQLIVLVGYEHERAAELIRWLEPDYVSLGYGRPGTATREEHQEANEHFHRLVRSSAAAYMNVQEFQFSCSNPWDTCEAILRETEDVGSANKVVAPMNTKISTVGSALATLRDEDIQLCYAEALQYNYEGYSRPGKHCYLFQLPEMVRGAPFRPPSARDG